MMTCVEAPEKTRPSIPIVKILVETSVYTYDQTAQNHSKDI
ncbi:hypothetical protein ACQFX9_16115 [Aliinostoc sp. HNIBRCY26]